MIIVFVAETIRAGPQLTLGDTTIPLPRPGMMYDGSQRKTLSAHLAREDTDGYEIETKAKARDRIGPFTGEGRPPLSQEDLPLN